MPAQPRRKLEPLSSGVKPLNHVTQRLAVTWLREIISPLYIIQSTRRAFRLDSRGAYEFFSARKSTRGAGDWHSLCMARVHSHEARKNFK